MGYTTDFEGRFELDRPLSPELQSFLTRFSKTRRMARNLPPNYGVEGEFYIDGGGPHGQDHEDNIIDCNEPPSTQPGLWCQWIPSEDGMYIQWDGGEKFYHYTEWLQYIITNFLVPHNHVLNGQVKWSGEGINDIGILEVKDNQIIVHSGVISLTEDIDVQAKANELLSMLSVYEFSMKDRERFINRLKEMLEGK